MIQELILKRALANTEMEIASINCLSTAVKGHMITVSISLMTQQTRKSYSYIMILTYDDMLLNHLK